MKMLAMVLSLSVVGVPKHPEQSLLIRTLRPSRNAKLLSSHNTVCHARMLPSGGGVPVATSSNSKSRDYELYI
jgi:hypothetical protein